MTAGKILIALARLGCDRRVKATLQLVAKVATEETEPGWWTKLELLMRENNHD